MILPLLVFLVVLIAVLVSYKREHFQTSSVSQTIPLATTVSQSDSSSRPNNTYISFIINNSSGNYDENSEDTTAQTSLNNSIIAAIISEFNDMDLDGGLINIQ